MKKSLALPAVTAAGISMISVALAQSPPLEPVGEDASVIAEPLQGAPVEEGVEMESATAGPECVNGYATLGNGVIILCGERPGIETAGTAEPDPPMGEVPDDTNEATTPTEEAADGEATEPM